MAVIAGIAAGDVVAGLAGGGGAVVAGEAGTDDAIVIKPCQGPGRGCMTIIAGARARNMSCGTAPGDVAIVAANTCTDYRAMVNTRDDFPRDGIVTIGTTVRGSEMIDRLLARRYARGECVAGSTTVWRSLKYSVDMAICALGVDVIANQRKPRGKVVEVAGSGRAAVGSAG